MSISDFFQSNLCDLGANIILLHIIFFYTENYDIRVPSTMRNNVFIVIVERLKIGTEYLLPFSSCFSKKN